MNKTEIKNLIEKTTREMIEKSSSAKKILSLAKKHDQKIHFIPRKYRILCGLLQSLNIQFGNFIEILMKNLVENETRYEIIKRYSGEKINTFIINKENDILIDEYISMCQSSNEIDLNNEFKLLLEKIVQNNLTNWSAKKDNLSIYSTAKHDIDLLFKDKETNKIYYLEIKYNDDHDTGKFVDINRKFIKTYAYLVNEFHISDYEEIVPILFFFTNKKMKGNIYVPEKSNIRRGEAFFKEFLSIKYDEIDKYLSETAEDPETLKMFDDLYNEIRQNY
ncbi:HinfI family type II restriction enzyme [Mycoplasma sp. 4463]|uniref:HinfI family type II restriction enzyme n=1 Tax=Mycoplasma sp. 4463 TaxID=3400998 RepID=UPI003AAAB3AA